MQKYSDDISFLSCVDLCRCLNKDVCLWGTVCIGLAVSEGCIDSCRPVCVCNSV